MKQVEIRRMVIWWVLLAVYLFVFNPVRLPLILLIIPFVLLFLAIRSTIALLVYVAQIYTNPSSRLHKNKRSSLETLCATVLVVFVALQSVGQLSAKDVLVVLLVCIIGYFYMTRNRVSD